MLATDGFMDFMESLIGKEISVLFNDGSDITGDLEKISSDKDYLILTSGSKKALVYLTLANMIVEGPVNWNDD